MSLQELLVSWVIKLHVRNCFENYITPDTSITSRSGLYASLLPGVDAEMLQGIAKLIDSSPEYDTWNELIYPRAIQNLISEISSKIQDKFFLDSKLVSRETSDFKADYNSTSGLAGLKFKFYLPKYARTTIETIEVWANGSSDFRLSFFDTDENGELLWTKDCRVEAGRNIIDIDHEFDIDQLFIAYDPTIVSLKQTQNKHFRSNSFWSEVLCDFDCLGYQRSVVEQINGGGLNVQLIVMCSIEKYICENIKAFKNVLWWKIGQEICIERRFGEQLNRFTTMTTERATELNNYYDFNFNKELDNSIRSLNMEEDPVCFACKSMVYATKILP